MNVLSKNKECVFRYFKFPSVQGASENPPPNSFCDDKSYYKYDGSCYKIDTTPRNYADAQEYCRSQGGDLASITDSYNEAFIEYLMYSNDVSAAWIGMTSNEVKKNFLFIRCKAYRP